MAEAAGLVIGAVSLTGLFTTCVDCFEYVQLGRRFGKDYQRSILKLDIVKLRLSRWADSINASGSETRLPTVSGTEVRKVEEILGEIVALFADAEKISARYRTERTESGLDVHGPASELEPSLQAMHNKMRELALKRQRRSTVAQKAIWAIYEEKHFRRLIEDVTGLVDSLLELFPAAQGEQRQRCVEDATEMETEANLPMLEQAAEGVDELFRGTVQSVIESQGSHTFTKNTATDDARVRYGDEHEAGETAPGTGHKYDENAASGKSRVHYGNKYGGKSVFDD
jgi:hypothetical protein